MNWDSRDPNVFAKDLGTRLSSYHPRSNVVAQKLSVNGQSEPVCSGERDDNSIKVWLDEVSETKEKVATRGVFVIFADRALEPFRNPQLLMDFPFSRPTFDKIIQEFLVNISIIRAINRQAATFSRTHFTLPNSPEPLISYNLRSSTGLRGDMAMSVTTKVKDGLTFVIVYGCKKADNDPIKSDASKFLARLQTCGPAFQHPMLFPGLFAEVQREKHVEIVEKAVEKLSEYVLNMDQDDEDGREDNDEERGPREGVNLWLDVAHYKTTLETWKVQLGKMVAHVDELSTTIYNEGSYENGAGMIREGTRIKERLIDILADYDELQRKCEWVIDGTTLANGMAWNHLAREDNKIQVQLAQSSKRDSTQMRSIALLTMIFLPGTFVASFFAMPLFKWDADKGKGEKLYSDYFWIYWVVTVALTVGVVSIWLFCSGKRRRQAQEGVACLEEGEKSSVSSVSGSG